MGKRYIYKGDVIGVVKDKRSNIWWQVAYLPDGKRIISKALKRSVNERVVQERLDAWAAKKGLDAVEDPKPGTKAEGVTLGKRIPVGALVVGGDYFLRRDAISGFKKLCYCGDMGNGQHLFRDLKNYYEFSYEFSADKLTHYEIREVVGA
ncbi:hypothetical protein FACS1894204_12480 [Synergistales bacterium]|nr:hypothetical protein FACS1894204_12480 [Synergistales bacterium]